MMPCTQNKIPSPYLSIDNIRTHLQLRSIMGCNWNECINATPLNYEIQVMEQVRVSSIEVMRGLLAWRRTTFLVALLLLLLNAAIGSIEWYPRGSIRATLRIRARLPESSPSSWIVAIRAPFYSVLFRKAMVVLLQVAGNALLMAVSQILTITLRLHDVFCRLW